MRVHIAEWFRTKRSIKDVVLRRLRSISRPPKAIVARNSERDEAVNNDLSRGLSTDSQKCATSLDGGVDSSRSAADNFRQCDSPLSPLTTPVEHENFQPEVVPSAMLQAPDTRSTQVPNESEELKPDEVACFLIVTYGKVASRMKHTIKWLQEDSYQVLDNAAIQCLRANFSDESKRFYRKSGRCRIMRDDTDKEVAMEILENKWQWSEVLPKMIMEFRSQNTRTKFHVEIHWEYSGLVIQRVPGQKYAETVKHIIEDKMRKNWENKKFIPRKDLEQIFTKETITVLVDEDETLHNDAFLMANGSQPLHEEDFIASIYERAIRLLALCIYTNLPLLCLHKMRSSGLEDTKLPMTNIECPEPACRVEFDFAMMIQGGFVAHKFDVNNTEHVQLGSSVVVPIMFDETVHRLGEGSFGNVYKVQIDGDHHFFSPNKDDYFALKIFFNRGAKTGIEVQNESSTLMRLAEAPHQNITTHLASWTQNSICYMLFRCADCNLRNFMTERPHPPLTKDNVLALLEQMKGLADGVRHIHNLGPSNLSPDGVNKKIHSGPAYGQSGFHHDLKPANILVWTNPETEKFIFTISDFGSARIWSLLSGSKPSPFTENLSPGDAVYGAPDALVEGKTARPYDLWSTGCIFLELLMWTLGLENSDLEQFAQARLEIPDKRASQDSAFWYMEKTWKSSKSPKSPNVRLKRAVIEQIKLLRTKCEGKGIFEHLIRTIGKLLIIPSEKRLDAPRLCNELDAILIQARRDLKDPDFYLNGHSFQDRIAAPPTLTQGDPGYLSREPSIDERSFEAPYCNPPTDEEAPWQRVTLTNGDLSGSPKEQIIHMRHSSYPNGESSPDPRRLSPIIARDLVTAGHRSRSPSVTLSEYGDESISDTNALREVGQQHEMNRQFPAAWDTINIPQEDIPRSGRRRRSPDSPST